MRKNRILATAAVVASTAVLAVGAGASTAFAGTPIGTTFQPHSNIRGGHHTSSEILFNTGSETATGDVLCYVRSDYVTAGGYGTNVWYMADVYTSTHGASQAWVWAGNANVGADPADGLSVC